MESIILTISIVAGGLSVSWTGLRLLGALASVVSRLKAIEMTLEILTSALEELKETDGRTSAKLFERVNNHEGRISKLEGRQEAA